MVRRLSVSGSSCQFGSYISTIRWRYLARRASSSKACVVNRCPSQVVVRSDKEWVISQKQWVVVSSTSNQIASGCKSEVAILVSGEWFVMGCHSWVVSSSKRIEYFVGNGG